MKEESYKEKNIVIGLSGNLDRIGLKKFLSELGFAHRKPRYDGYKTSDEIATYSKEVNGTLAFVIYHDRRYPDDIWVRDSGNMIGVGAIRSQLVVKIAGLTEEESEKKRELYNEQTAIAMALGTKYDGVVYDEEKREVLNPSVIVNKPKRPRKEKPKEKDIKGIDPEREREWRAIKREVARKRRAKYNIWHGKKNSK